MQKGTKRQNKTKEQIGQEMVQRQQIERKRKFVADVLWPFLIERTGTVREAKMFCRVAISDIQTTFAGGMSSPLSSLNLQEKFGEENDKGAEVYRAFVEAFKDVPINETLELLDGMPNAIDAAINYESTTRSLKEMEFHDGIITAKKGDSFPQLLKDTPECNDFRQMGDGTWMAYSTKKTADGKDVYRANGATILEALTNLKTKLCE